MIPTVQMDKYYSYKDIHNYIYLIRIDQIGRAIRIYDIYFYKDDLEIENSLKDKIYEVIFDELDKKEKDDI